MKRITMCTWPVSSGYSEILQRHFIEASFEVIPCFSGRYRGSLSLEATLVIRARSGIFRPLTDQLENYPVLRPYLSNNFLPSLLLNKSDWFILSYNRNPLHPQNWERFLMKFLDLHRAVTASRFSAPTYTGFEFFQHRDFSRRLIQASRCQPWGAGIEFAGIGVAIPAINLRQAL